MCVEFLKLVEDGVYGLFFYFFDFFVGCDKVFFVVVVGCLIFFFFGLSMVVILYW